MRAPRLLVVDRSAELGEHVELATSKLRPRPEVLSRPTLPVREKSRDEGNFDVLIAGPSVVTDAGLRRLRQLRLEQPDIGIILTFERRPHASLREIVRAGAVDALQLPVDDGVLALAVEEALAFRPLTEDGDLTRPPRHAAGQGAVAAVVSATGGCGKTFFATNLAYYLQATGKKRTCVVDLDLQFGELSTALRLRPKYTIIDLLSREGGDEGSLAEALDDCLVVHDTGVHVLAAPAEPAEADAIEPGDVARVISALRSRFDYVIVDTPPALTEAVLVSVELADHIYAVATLDLPSVRNLGVLLSTFSDLKLPTERVELVLNKVEPNVGIDVQHVTRYFPQGFSITVPYGREVNRSINMGVPILAYLPTSPVSRSLSAGLAASFPAAGQVEARASRHRAWIGSLRRRSGGAVRS